MKLSEENTPISDELMTIFKSEWNRRKEEVMNVQTEANIIAFVVFTGFDYYVAHYNKRTGDVTIDGFLITNDTITIKK